MPTTQRPYLRDGRLLTHDELCELAHAELADSEYTQEELADELDVTRNAIARATTTPGARWQKLQQRIAEELTPYDFEREETVRFRAHRRPDNGET